MGLTKAQLALITKARTASVSESGVPLDDGICAYLLAVIARDLELLDSLPEINTDIPSFFGSQSPISLRLDGVAFLPLFERLLAMRADVDTYFYCLAIVHKARLKYERILQTQATPTIDQVGPRGLLQYGTLSPKALAGFLFWRKWLFDIDNRAGQETGYVFEPIIAYAIGGVPYSAKKSPVKRDGVGQQGRQVDCIRDQRAYEIKVRVTIAASGQGRWGEELEFPNDCQASGYTPVLIVLDPTPSPKLHELSKAFIHAGGEVYIGQNAWDHLASQAGQTMARFLDTYVHNPLQTLLREAPLQLPKMTLEVGDNTMLITIGGEKLIIRRNPKLELAPNPDELPDDIDEDTPGL